MVLNYIWVAFFGIAFLIAAGKLVFAGDAGVFPAIMDSTFSSAKTAFEISLGLTGVLSLWMGIMKIGEKGGVVHILARGLSPLFCKLFPDIPKNHPVIGNIFMNISANMLGLDNAATPLGLKAMEGLQELNPKKDTASNPMIMFLVLNTSGLTIIPVSIMVYRTQMGAAQPTDRRFNNSLKDLARALHLQSPVTSYTLRHSWATTAKYRGVPIEMISESLGHKSIKTTQIYLKGFGLKERTEVNKGNLSYVRNCCVDRW